MERKYIFQNIFDQKIWMDSGDSETPSGSGSNRANTILISENLNKFIEANQVRSILDVGCGTGNWQDQIKAEYIGIDIIETGSPLNFKIHDIVESPFDQHVDLVLMRNFLQHQTLSDIEKILENLRYMKPRFIVANYSPLEENCEIRENDIYRYRRVDLTIEPFNLPNPIEQLQDHQVPMGVWLGSDLEKLSNLITSESSPSTALIAILAKNKAHTLPHFFHCLLEQTYPKKLITLYIRTNNNRDKTLDIIQKFISQHEKKYAKVILEDEDIEISKSDENPHEWTNQRFKVLGEIRQKSMKKCLEEGCDYYFVVDCDNFITPITLEHLIKERKPIIAPLLLPFGRGSNDIYSNYFCNITHNGFYKSHPDYTKIFNRQMIGTFRVPLVHCTYLIDARVIPHLTYDDNTGTYEFIIFSRSARLHAIEQFICNQYDFGELLHPEDDITLEKEVILFSIYLTGIMRERKNSQWEKQRLFI